MDEKHFLGFLASGDGGLGVFFHQLHHSLPPDGGADGANRPAADKLREIIVSSAAGQSEGEKRLALFAVIGKYFKNGAIVIIQSPDKMVVKRVRNIHFV